MYSKYLPAYKANVDTDILRVRFYRLHEDTRDIMCDSLAPQWGACDDFIINIYELHTEHHHEERNGRFGKTIIDYDEETILREMEIRTTSKQAANYIWYLAKNGSTFADIKAMHEAEQF